MPQYGMVIDLHKCVGCGACGIACKNGNNTDDRANGQSHNWVDYMIKVDGKFPNINYTNYPVLCNHCSKAPCVEACPVEPKAMYKTKDGITMHNHERCIGCQSCQYACPYSDDDLDAGNSQYSVISMNFEDEPTHARYVDTTSISDGNASGAAMAAAAGATPPYKTEYTHPDYEPVRRPGIVGKCIFCEHLVQNGELPYCVQACPSSARTFGDLSDDNSNVSKLLKTHESIVLKPEEGTQPNVYYIDAFSIHKRTV